MHFLVIFLFFSTHLHSINAIPRPRRPLWSRAEKVPEGVPEVRYPDYGDASNCPEQYTNLFNQAIQKRDLELPSDLQTSPKRYASALQPRQYQNCQKIGHFTWADWIRPLGNTQDVYLWGGSTYTFSIASSVPIYNAYAWTSDYGSDHYTLIGTGGDGSNQATIIIKLTEGKHVHFEAFSKEEMSSGRAALFKQDPTSK